MSSADLFFPIMLSVKPKTQLPPDIVAFLFTCTNEGDWLLVLKATNKTVPDDKENKVNLYRLYLGKVYYQSSGNSHFTLEWFGYASRLAIIILQLNCNYQSTGTRVMQTGFELLQCYVLSNTLLLQTFKVFPIY